VSRYVFQPFINNFEIFRQDIISIFLEGAYLTTTNEK
jgi:hypothetical protein